MTYTTLSQDEVTMFLNNRKPLEDEITVIFLKKDGSQRKMTGTFDYNSQYKNMVMMFTEESARPKSFNKDTVLWIGGK